MSKLVLAALLTLFVGIATPSVVWAQDGAAPRVAGMPAPAAQPAAVEAPAPASVTPGTQPATPVSAPGGFGPNGLLIMMAGVLGLMIFMSVMGGRKEKRRRQELVGSLQKGSRVQMSGGIIVTELGDDEVVVRSEDGRIRFAKSAVAAVLRDSRDKPAAGEVEVKGEKSHAGASA